MKKLLLLLLASTLIAQAKQFSSVSIKVRLATEDVSSTSIVFTPMVVRATSINFPDATAWALLVGQFPGPWNQIVLGPGTEWIEDLMHGFPHYQIIAIPPAGWMESDIPGMVTDMLVKKFGLKTHSEMRMIDTFTLLPDKTIPPERMQSPKKITSKKAMVVMSPQDRMKKDVDLALSRASAKQKNEMKKMGIVYGKYPSSPSHVYDYELQDNVGALIKWLQDYVKYPVFDLTGLDPKAIYDFKFSIKHVATEEALRLTGNSLVLRNLAKNCNLGLEGMGYTFILQQRMLPVTVIDSFSKTPAP